MLYNVSLIDKDSAPDHFLEEIEKLSLKMIDIIEPFILENDRNVLINAITLMYISVLINTLKKDVENIRSFSKNVQRMIGDNMEKYIKVILEDER